MSKAISGYFKAIASDKFDFAMLPDFWAQLSAYLQEKNKGTEKKLLKKGKIDTKQIFLSIQRLLQQTQTRGGQIAPETSLSDIDTCFQMLLHPETPQDIRSMSFTMFLSVLATINESNYNRLKGSIEFAIPYQIIADGQWDPSCQGSAHQLFIEGEKCSQKEAVIELDRFFDFIKGPEFANRSKVALSLLGELVLSVVYKEVKQDMGQTPKQYGFRHVPETCHEKVLSYLVSVAQTPSFSWEYYNDSSKLRFLAKLVAQTERFAAKKDLVSKAFNFLKAMCTGQNGKHVLSVSVDIFEDFLDTFLRIVDKMPEVTAKQVIGAAHQFLTGFLITFRSKIPPSMFLQIINKIWSAPCNQKDELYMAMMTTAVCAPLVEDKESEKEIWDTVLEHVKSSTIVTAVLCRFAQYLATRVAPYIFRWDIEATKEFCIDIASRTKRNKTKNSYDFVSENIQDILERPAHFVSTKLSQAIGDLAYYDAVMKDLTMPELTGIPKTADGALSAAEAFLSVFNIYTQYPSGSEQQNLYSVMYTFFSTLTMLQEVPPGVTCDRVMCFTMASPHLFFCMMSTMSTTLRSLAMNTCGTLLNTLQVSKTADVSVLSHWFVSLFCFMLFKDKTLACSAFDHAAKSIRLGIPGATCLVPLMVSLLENKCITFGSEITGFLAATPLFTGTCTPPSQEFMSRVISRVKFITMDDLIDNVNSLLSPNVSDLRTRTLAIIRDMSGNIDMLGAVCENIAYEITQDYPSADTLAFLLQLFVKPVLDCQVEIHPILESLLMYSEAFERYCPDAWFGLAEHIIANAARLTGAEEANWMFAIITLANEMSVHCYNCLKTKEVMRKYFAFLYNCAEGIGELQGSVCESVRELCNYSIYLIGQYFGYYPFPKGPFNCSNTEEPPNRSKHIYVGQDDCIIRVTTNETSATLSTITRAGQHALEFTPICREFMNDELIPEFEVPNTYASTELTPAENSDFQRQFTDTIDEIVAEIEREEHINFQLDAIDDDDSEVPAALAMMQEKLSLLTGTEAEKPWKIRAATTIDSPAAAALTALGRLDPLQPEKLQRLDETDKVNTVMTKLTDHEHRIKMKIAVIYAGKGKVDQNEILSTTFEETSPHFKEFLLGLGYPVQISTCKGYRGGLDVREGRSGTTSIYYSDFESDCMFHVAPLLPTSATDPQQVFKKRHIGNDRVHIVYCDSEMDYAPTTITCQFGMVQIIVYPLPTGLFRVDVYSRNDVPFFGPLTKHTIVTKKMLPSLVRATAISATAAQWRAQKELNAPIVEMSELIDDLSHNHRANDRYVYMPYQFAMSEGLKL